MDHLSWSDRSGRPRLQVPYLVKDADNLDDLDNFRILPEIRNFDARRAQSLLELATAAQTWLYFGLLKVWLQKAFQTSDFVENGLVHTKNLDTVVNACSDNSRLLLRSNRETVNQQAQVIFDTYKLVLEMFSLRVVPQVAHLESASAEDELTLWNSAAHRVLFSIPVLFSFLEPFLPVGSTVPRWLGEPRRLLDLRTLGFSTQTAGVARTVAVSGRCPSLLRRLKLLEQDIYPLISFPSRVERSVHERCSVDECAANDIDESTYQTKHTESCVQSTCRDLGFECESLYRVIDEGCIPLVCSSVNPQGEVAIELHAGTFDSSYTAISHVWAGDLGNTEGNSLPSCQIEQIHQWLQNGATTSRDSFVSYYLPAVFSAWGRAISSRLRTRLSKNSRHIFYMDTLCVPRKPAVPHISLPVSPTPIQPDEPGPDSRLQPSMEAGAGIGSPSTEPASLSTISDADHQQVDDSLASANRAKVYRRRAIDAMARIYSGADSVLVLDPELQREEVTQLRKFETPLAVACSPWIARSWTLQEGALALKVIFQFATESKRFSDILNQRLFPLIETAWVDLVQTSHHPERTVGVLQYIEHTFLLPAANPSFMASQPAWTLESWDLDQFIQAWNALTERTTNKLEDVAAILASLLNLSAGEILSLQLSQRTQALLARHTMLPATILLVPTMKQLAGSEQWIPKLPSTGDSAIQMTLDSGRVQVTDTGLVFDTKPGREQQWWYVVPSWTEGDSLPSSVRMPDGLFLKLTPRLDETGLGAQVMPGPRILWFTMSRDANGRALGRWFGAMRNDDDGLHVAIGEVFSSQVELEATSQQTDWPSEYHSLAPISSLLNDSRAFYKPIIVDMDIKSWPKLNWSRTTAFPITRFGGTFGNVLFITLAGWTIHILTAHSMITTWLLFSGDRDLDAHLGWPPELRKNWPRIFLLDVIFLVRVGIAVWEWRSLDRKETQWIQHIYAASFWSNGVHTDTADARATHLLDTTPASIYPKFVVIHLLVQLGLGMTCALVSIILLRQMDKPPWTAFMDDGIAQFFNSGFQAIYASGFSGFIGIVCSAFALEFLGRSYLFLFYLYSWYRAVGQSRSRKPGGPKLQHEIGRTLFVITVSTIFGAFIYLTYICASRLSLGVLDEDRPGVIAGLLLFPPIVLVTGYILFRPVVVNCALAVRTRYRRWRELPGAIQLE